MRRTHRVLMRVYGIRPVSVLNPGHAGDRPPPSAAPAAELQTMAKSLQGAAFNPGGGGLDYASLARSAEFRHFGELARSLAGFEPGSLSGRAERLAFWINLYNALVVHGVIAFGVRRSINEVRGFLWRAAYNVGGRRYAAHDIEHGLLRANAPHPAIPGAHFGRDDPRRGFSLAELDTRVHFALVCAARSCPPIRAYTADQVDDQLTLAARAFVRQGGADVDADTRTVWMSQIFQLYAADFGAAPLGLGSRQPLLKAIAPYVDEAQGRHDLLDGTWRVRFVRYDWKLNGVPA